MEKTYTDVYEITNPTPFQSRAIQIEDNCPLCDSKTEVCLFDPPAQADYDVFERRVCPQCNVIMREKGYVRQ